LRESEQLSRSLLEQIIGSLGLSLLLLLALARQLGLLLLLSILLLPARSPDLFVALILVLALPKDERRRFVVLALPMDERAQCCYDRPPAGSSRLGALLRFSRSLLGALFRFSRSSRCLGTRFLHGLLLEQGFLSFTRSLAHIGLELSRAEDKREGGVWEVLSSSPIFFSRLILLSFTRSLALL
jgi:hypothetical protein